MIDHLTGRVMRLMTGAITLRTMGVIIAVIGVRKINVSTFLTLTQSRGSLPFSSLHKSLAE